MSCRGPGRSWRELVTRHLDGPFGLVALRGHRYLTAESVSGQVTRIGPGGSQHVLFGGAAGVAGVAAGPKHFFAVLGGADETGPAPGARYPASSVLRSTRQGRHVSVIADGGANDVLKVNPTTGRVSTFFVPPTVTDVPACLADGAQSNPGTVGCDPVPTGIAAARGSVCVSTLGAEVPGAGRVYNLDPRIGHVQRVWRGLTAPTGIAVVGRITRIKHGVRTHSQVTMPTGLSLRRGRLYASAWSVASFVGIQHAGQVVRVRLSSFH